MKLIHNMVLGTVMASLAEGMALAEKVGLDQEDLHEVLTLGALNCPTINHKGQGQLAHQGYIHSSLYCLSVTIKNLSVCIRSQSLEGSALTAAPGEVTSNLKLFGAVCPLESGVNSSDSENCL